MQAYDLMFLAILVVCCFTGFTNGAIRSLLNFISLVIGLIIALCSRGFMAGTFHLDNLTGWIAALVIFVIVYMGLRYLGNALSDKVHKEKTYGNIDRIAGLGIGIVSTLVFIGAFHLLFSLVVPIERQDDWFRKAKVYPVGARCAKIIQAFIPVGAKATKEMNEANPE
jgi:membrane protein required for colicin V production